jgi:hypothetical protein
MINTNANYAATGQSANTTLACLSAAVKTRVYSAIRLV